MAIDPRISLAAQTPGVMTSIQQGLGVGEQIRNQGVRDRILKQQEQAGAMNQAVSQGTFMNKFMTGLTSTPIENRAAVIAQSMPMMEQMGIDPSQFLGRDLSDQSLQQGIMSTIPFAQASAQAKPQIKEVDPTKFTPESLKQFQQSGDYGVLQPITEGETNNWAEIQKEARGSIRKSVTGLSDQAGILTTNYGKLEGLAGEMRKGNRSAVAQGLVALVKLGDPNSVVKEEELKQALGAQSPTAAVADLLRNKGTDGSIINSVVQSLDPLNPDTVNVDQILSTANAMMIPNINNILGSYEYENQRGGELLTQQGYQSIFGTDNPMFGSLKSLAQQIQAQQSSGVIQKPTSPGQTGKPAIVKNWSDL